jgi:hypothetical protein
MKPSILRYRKAVESLVDMGSLDGGSFKYLQMLAVIAVLSVWYLESSTGTLSWWDAYAYPVITFVLSCGALVAIFFPAYTPSVRFITVGTINTLMVYEIHMILWHTTLIDMYQLSATLLWLPLALSLSFLFLNNRAAMVLTGGVLVYEVISFTNRIALVSAGVDAPATFPPCYGTPSLHRSCTHLCWSPLCTSSSMPWMPPLWHKPCRSKRTPIP